MVPQETIDTAVGCGMVIQCQNQKLITHLQIVTTAEFEVKVTVIWSGFRIRPSRRQQFMVSSR